MQGTSCAESRSYGKTGAECGVPGFAHNGSFEKHGLRVQGKGLLFGLAYTNSVPGPPTELDSTFTGHADAVGADPDENAFDTH